MEKIRGFEIVSDEFRKFPNEEIKMPFRATKKSAGYDFYSNEDFILSPKESHTFWLDLKTYMLDDEVLKIFVRSSIAIKKNLVLKNQVGIIDADYYSNVENDGNIGVCLHNKTDNDIEIKKGERIAQGIFQKYLVADNIESENERVGGIGSSK